MKSYRTFAAAPLLLALAVAPAFAGGVQDEMAGALSGIEEKLVGLAEAMPEEKYDWSPMEGVRSTGEVFNHVAAANYFIAKSLGAEVPEGVDMGALQKTSGKEEIIEQLKKSMEHAKEAVAAVPDEEVGASIQVFGRESTKHGAMLALVEHASEHLGQAIAYARMNEVVPPWSN